MPRQLILDKYAQWTALCALRQGPIRSRATVYPAIQVINFDPVVDLALGAITHDEFETWHQDALELLVNSHENMHHQFGWAAKIINIYLKTYCYVGEFGRPGIREHLHPPIDGGLWEGTYARFSVDHPEIVAATHEVTTIEGINNHDLYMRLIGGFRMAAVALGCTLIEVEQLWQGANAP